MDRLMQLDGYGEAYERPKRKLWPYLAVLIVLGLAAFFFFNPFQAKELSGSIEEQVTKAVEKEGKYTLQFQEKGTCYWIKPGHDGENYLVEIRKYNSTDSCAGNILDVTQVVVDAPVNINGRCICGSACSFVSAKKDGVKYLSLEGCK